MDTLGEGPGRRRPGGRDVGRAGVPLAGAPTAALARGGVGAPAFGPFGCHFVARPPFRAARGGGGAAPLFFPPGRDASEAGCVCAAPSAWNVGRVPHPCRLEGRALRGDA